MSLRQRCAANKALSVIGIVATFASLVCCFVLTLPRAAAIGATALAFVSYTCCYAMQASVLTGPIQSAAGCGEGSSSGKRCVSC
jgi:hypothetical protein